MQEYDIVCTHYLSHMMNGLILKHCIAVTETIHFSRIMIKQTKWYVRPAKTQISLSIRPVWLESSQCAQWVAEDPMFLHAQSEDSDQSGRMPRLIRVFAGHKSHFVGFVMRLLISQILSNGIVTEEVLKWLRRAINRIFFLYLIYLPSGVFLFIASTLSFIVIPVTWSKYMEISKTNQKQTSVRIISHQELFRGAGGSFGQLYIFLNTCMIY